MNMFISGQLDQKDAVRESIKDLTKILEDYVHPFPFIHQVGDLIIKGDQITKKLLCLVIALFFKCLTILSITF